MAAEFYASGLGEPDLHESGELVKVNRTIAWQNYQADNPAAAKDELIAVQVNFSKVLWKLLTGTELDDF